VGLRRFNSWEHIDTHDPVEYFLASDASAVIEHTRRVIFLEDDDVVHVKAGGRPPPCVLALAFSPCAVSVG
jgi:hypothetical protein